MFRLLDCRAGHYLLLLTVWAGLCLPRLGAPSLWDIDEGNNAEAAREMLKRDDWVIPQFNFNLRVDKPALLYWLQISAYQVFGINEFAARLPSALAALGAVLTTYELGRRLSGAVAALLAGLALASTLSFCVSAHFANPDALLNLFTVLTFFCFWRGIESSAPSGRIGALWFVLAGASEGLAMLAKGPVGFVLPMTVVALFLLWSRRLWLLFDRRIVLGILVFLLVAAPWYALVGSETKGEFLRGFFLTHNLARFRAPMENHRGPIYYYVAILLAGFAPWSAFLGLTTWNAWQTLRGKEQAPSLGDACSGVRLLFCWIAVYLVFFSAAGTKLPNYVLPLYPALAILTAQFLDRWRRGLVAPPAWTMKLGLACLFILGFAATGGLLLTAGFVDLTILHGRRLPELAIGSVLGFVPMLGAGAAWWFLGQGNRSAGVVAVAAAAVIFLAGLAGWGSTALERYRAPRSLALALPANANEQEIRLAAYQYFQPSLVFYCRREINQLDNEKQALEFLECPLPAYVFMPASVWNELQPKAAGPHHVLNRHYDLYRNCDLVVVVNR